MVLLGAGFLPLLFAFIVTKSITSRGLEGLEREKIAAVGREIARQISMTMDSASSDLESLKGNRIVVDPSLPMDERVDELRRIVKARPSFSDITIYDPNGLMEASTTNRNHPEPTDATTWLTTARDKNIVCTSPPQMVSGQPGLHIRVYIPIHIHGQAEPSILKARLTFDPVWDLIDGVKVGRSGEMFVLDSRGKILAARDKNLILEKFDDRYPSVFWLKQQVGNYTNTEGEIFAYNAQVLTRNETHVEEPWIVLSFLPKHELTSVLRESETYQYATGVAALWIAVVLGLALSKRLAEPVVRASVAAQKVALGDLQTDVPETGPREMKQLAASFNQMMREVRDTRSRLESLVETRTRKLRQSQSELEALTSQLRAAYESTREAILVVKPDGTILAANRRLQEFFNLDDTEELTALQFSDLQSKLDQRISPGKDKRDLWSFFEDNPGGTGEGEWEIGDPAQRTLSVYTAPVRNQRGSAFARLWMFRDITEQRQLEQSLQQAQKMEAIGRLAGGVAHDFNNLLTGIIGNLSLAQMDSSGNRNRDSDRFIASAKQAGQRAAELVKQLLGFSRRSHLQLASCEVNDLILEVQDLLQHTIDPRIRIEVDLPGAIWNIRADATQIQQVLMNMCVNSTDAMAKDGGRISLSTRNVHLGREQAGAINGAVPGPYVRISVEDNGHGMSHEVREKIFEPFFTTKDPGKGTGLGLATSYGIIRQHGGWITCESESGVGTTFHIYLPKIEKTDATAKKTPAELQPAEAGSETVLLVDDEQIVRSVAENTLLHHGYRVICASDGEEALKICRERGHEINVVILDLTMPKLSGQDTFRKMQEAESPLPVIICSGYLVDLDLFEEETGARPAGFVQKPFNLNALANAIREALRPAAVPA